MRWRSETYTNASRFIPAPAALTSISSLPDPESDRNILARNVYNMESTPEVTLVLGEPRPAAQHGCSRTPDGIRSNYDDSRSTLPLTHNTTPSPMESFDLAKDNQSCNPPRTQAGMAVSNSLGAANGDNQAQAEQDYVQYYSEEPPMMNTSSGLERQQTFLGNAPINPGGVLGFSSMKLRDRIDFLTDWGRYTIFLPN